MNHHLASMIPENEFAALLDLLEYCYLIFAVAQQSNEDLLYLTVVHVHESKRRGGGVVAGACLPPGLPNVFPCDYNERVIGVLDLDREEIVVRALFSDDIVSLIEVYHVDSRA